MQVLARFRKPNCSNPTSELVDILYKREIRGDKPKPGHEQDIANLRLITHAREVEARLAE